MNSYIITDGGIMVSIGMTPYNVEVSHPRYTEILEAVREKDWDAIPDLVSIANAIKSYGFGKVIVDVEHGVVTYQGEEIADSLTNRMLRMMQDGFTIDPLVNFLDNLMLNPSARSIEELHGFLEYGKMPITEDGYFLAYKRVREDYMSCHDGKTDNSIGNVVQMSRNKVDDRSDNTCSYGLHFCSHQYLSSFHGAKVVVLKIHPRDVVSIPTDYNDTKGRACRYQVVGELSPEEVEKALAGTGWDLSVNTDYDDRDTDFDPENDWEDDWKDDDEIFFRASPEIEGEGPVSRNYVLGYDDGYFAGRTGQTGGHPHDRVDDLSKTEDWLDGYSDGHRDGRGHKRKLTWVEITD